MGIIPVSLYIIVATEFKFNKKTPKITTNYLNVVNGENIKHKIWENFSLSVKIHKNLCKFFT